MNTDAIIILLGKVRGYHRERHIAADPAQVLSTAARLMRTRRNVRDVIILVPQPGGPLRWIYSDPRFSRLFGEVRP